MALRPLAALLLTLLAAQAWSASSSRTRIIKPELSAGLEGLWMGIYLPTDQLNIAPATLGYPAAPGALMNLLGGGAVIAKGQLLFTVQGMNGDMSSELNGRFSNWGLQLAGVIAEQRYEAGSFDFTAGLAVWLGTFFIDLRDNNGDYTRFDSRFPAGGLTGALRWPNHSRLAFFARTGYFWLPASGNWRGSKAASMTKNTFDLNTTFTQAGIDVMF